MGCGDSLSTEFHPARSCSRFSSAAEGQAKCIGKGGRAGENALTRLVSKQ